MDGMSFFFIFFAFFVLFIIIGIIRRRAIRRQILAQNAAYVAANAQNFQVQQAVQAQQAHAAYYGQHVAQVGINPNGQQPAYYAAARVGQIGGGGQTPAQYPYAAPPYSQSQAYAQPPQSMPPEGQPNNTSVEPHLYQGTSPPPGYTQ